MTFITSIRYAYLVMASNLQITLCCSRSLWEWTKQFDVLVVFLRAKFTLEKNCEMNNFSYPLFISSIHLLSPQQTNHVTFFSEKLSFFSVTNLFLRPKNIPPPPKKKNPSWLVVESPIWKTCSSKWKSSPNRGENIIKKWNHHPGMYICRNYMCTCA